jgi:hypothetical protein
MGKGVLRRDPMAFARATAIIAGLMLTVAGFLVGSVRRPIGPL